MLDELEAEGWTYGDLPWLTVELFEKFIDIIGSDNIRFVASSVRITDKGTFKRGQYMISPEGQKRGEEYAKRLPSRPSTSR